MLELNTWLSLEMVALAVCQTHIYTWTQSLAEPRDGGLDSSSDSYILGFGAWMNLEIMSYYPLLYHSLEGKIRTKAKKY